MSIMMEMSSCAGAEGGGVRVVIKVSSSAGGWGARGVTGCSERSACL